MTVQVERVVDVVQNIFKTSSALSLFENSPMLEIPYAQLQRIITSLLTNVKITYKQGLGFVNAQDLQIQCLLEFEKLKLKISGSKRTIQPKQQSGAPAAQEKSTLEKKTFLPIDAILYPKETNIKKKQQQIKSRHG